MGAVVSQHGEPKFHRLGPEECTRLRRRGLGSDGRRARPGAILLNATPTKAREARAEASSPVFERPQDSPGREEHLPGKAPRPAQTAAKPRPRVLPPTLADRPCSIEAMPKERRELYKNVPCCGGRGCPQCSLMALGFR